MGAYLEVRATTDSTTESKRRMQEQILEMRSAGMSFPQMARALGVGQMYVHKLYYNALNAIIEPGVEKLRKQEGERLDMMLIPVMAKIMTARDRALQGDTTFEAPTAEIQAALAISVQRAKIFGLNAPTRVEGAPYQNGVPLNVGQLNLNTMDTAELIKFRDLLAKATVVEAGDADDRD